MSKFLDIRKLLGLKQAELAEVLGVSQGTISFYENGKTVPPDVAARLLQVAEGKGYRLTFDHVYGDAPIPEPATEATGSSNA